MAQEQSMTILGQDAIPCERCTNIQFILIRAIFQEYDSEFESILSTPMVMQAHWEQFLQNTVLCSCIHCCLQFYIVTKNIRYQQTCQNRHETKGIRDFLLHSFTSININDHCLLFRRYMKNKERFNDLFQFYCDLLASDPFKYQTYFYQLYRLMNTKNAKWILSNSTNMKSFERWIGCLNKHFWAQDMKQGFGFKKDDQTLPIAFALSKINKRYLKYLQMFGIDEWGSQGIKATVWHVENMLTKNEKKRYKRQFMKKERLKQCGHPKCNVNTGKNMRICGGCQLIYFCSRKCQKDLLESIQSQVSLFEIERFVDFVYTFQ